MRQCDKKGSNFIQDLDFFRFTWENCLRFANPAEAIGGRHSEAWRLRCVEAQKLEGSDMLILAASWIFLMASGVLPRFMFFPKALRAKGSRLVVWGSGG